MNQTERQGLLQALVEGLAGTGGAVPAPGTGSVGPAEFPDGTGWSGGAIPDDKASLAAAVEAAIAAGRAAWPAVSLGDAEFASHLGRVLGAGGKTIGDVAASTVELHLADLFLAAACARGDPAALAAFEARYLGPLPAVLGGAGVSAQDADVVAAVLREKLLVARGDNLPAISSYAGRGPLAAWVAIAAQREATSQRRHEGVLQRAHERAMAEGFDGDLDPELRILKNHYREDVEAAFREALTRLADRDRVLLRLALAGKLTMEAIATSYNVNATTVSRWLGRIRERLRDETVAILCERLRLNDREAVSIARLVTSQLEVSVNRLL